VRPIYLASQWGSTFFLGLALKRAGVPVTLYIKEEASRGIGTGLIAKTTDVTPPKDALVIFDGTGMGEWGAHLRRKGHPVIGGNAFDRDLEINRWKGIEIMRQAGIATPDTHQFTTTGAAQAFLDQHDGDWFIKVSGASVTEDSTCNGDADTLGRYLRWVASQPGDKSFILQQKVTGVEISTEGWFDGARFVPPFDSTLEDKKFLEGELGPRTGCEACVVWPHAQSRLGDVLGRLAGALARERYVGPIDLNAIVADGDVFGLEWTARLGFDATQAWLQLLEPDTVADQLEDFALRRLSRWVYRPGVAATLRITVQPYPNGNTRECKAKAGYPLDKVWVSGGSYLPEDVKLGREGPELAGASGIVGVLAQRGASYPALKRTLKGLADDLKLPGKQYRIDPLTRVDKDVATLRRLNMVDDLAVSGLTAAAPARGLVTAAKGSARQELVEA
jgi:phosphoribosylamine-glycine ligase